MSVVEQTTRSAEGAPSALRYVRFRREYLPALHAIEEASYPDPWTEGMFRQELTNASSHFYVVFLGEELIGYGGFWFVIGEAHITKLTVSEAYRGRGYGKELMEFLFQKGAALGAATFRLEVREGNIAARRLYAGLGFEEVGLRKGYYIRTNETAVIMEKAVDNPGAGLAGEGC